MKNIIYSALSNLINFLFSKGAMVVAGAFASHYATIEDAKTLTIIITTISAFGTLFQQAISTTHIRYNGDTITHDKKYKATLVALIGVMSVPVSMYLYYSSSLSPTNAALTIVLLIVHGASGFKIAAATQSKKFKLISLIGTLQGLLLLLTLLPLIAYSGNSYLYTVPFLLTSLLWLFVNPTRTETEKCSATILSIVKRTFLPAIFTGLFFMPVIWLLLGYVQSRFGDQESFLLATANQWRMTIGILPTIFGGYLLLLLVNSPKDTQHNKNINFSITYYPAVIIAIFLALSTNKLSMIYPDAIVRNGDLQQTIMLFMLASILTSFKSSISREMVAAELAKLSILSNMIWAGIFSLIYFTAFNESGATGVAKAFLASQVIHLILWAPALSKHNLVPKSFFDKKFYISLIPIAWITYTYAI